MRERLNVFCAGRQVGVLEYDDVRRCFAFSYDAGYLASEEAMPISLSLPLQEEPAGVLESRYFFENLLPPEIVRRRLEKIIHVSWDNVFGMLKALGGDCAGAISLYAEGQGPEFESERLRELTDDEADEVLKLLPQRPLLVDKIKGIGYPLHVEYFLTERGRKMLQAVLVMQEVGIEFMVERGQRNFLEQKGISCAFLDDEKSQ